MNKVYIALGAASILISIAIKMLLIITKNNNTIELLYEGNSSQRIRKYIEKVKSVFSVIIFVIGVIFIIIGLFN